MRMKMATPIAMFRGPVLAKADQARRFNVFNGEAVTPIIASDDVEGAFAIWLHVALPGVSPPRHVHYLENEVFRVLEGSCLSGATGRL
jgi:hypothetical protein